MLYYSSMKRPLAAKKLKAVSYRALACVSRHTCMKTNKKAVLAKSPKNTATVKPTKIGKAKAKALPVILLGTLYALLHGARGFALRLVKASKQGDILTLIPLQNNKGLTAVKPEPCYVDSKGIVTGSKTAKCQLGTYVNGKSSGATCQLLTKAQFIARSKAALVLWNIDGKPAPCRYIGNPAEKGMSAVLTANGYAWQIEQDSNSHNKHERGKLLPLTKSGKLVNVS